MLPPYNVNMLTRVLSGGRPDLRDDEEEAIRTNIQGEVLLKLMKKCWDQKPSTRPSFDQITETLRSVLDDSIMR